MTEATTTTSWLTRLKNAFIGILAGLGLIIGAIILIFWNEGHSLHTAQSLEQTKKTLISVPIAPINKNNNLKPVYLSGLATTKENLEDPILGISINAIHLNRKVEMYQWKQKAETKTESQLGGSEKNTTTYSYEKIWSENLIDSDGFKNPLGHKNPTSIPIQSHKEYAKTVTLGDFFLPEILIHQINASQPINLAQANIDSLKTKINKPIKSFYNELYLGEDKQNPQPGDLRINLNVVKPQIVSIIAQQTGDTFQAYHAPAGENVMLILMGQHPSDEMIKDAKSENTLTTWIIRLVSLLLLIGGFNLIMQPVVILTDVIPFLGSIMGFGTTFIAVVCGLSLWLIVTAIAWFTTRPFMSIGLMLLVILGWYGLNNYRKSNTFRSQLEEKKQ